MSVIRAFRGLRPAKKYQEKLPSYPYDVINSDEARELAKDNPFSFLHIVKPEIDLDPAISLYDDRVYAKAVENLGKFISDGVLVFDDSDYLYVYQQVMNGHVQKGILGCASVDDYLENVIKKHELTRKDKEDDRTRHTSEINANAGPVFLTYRAVSRIDQIVEKITEKAPDHDFTAPDKIRHTLWVIRDQKTITEIVEIFRKDIPVLYVADGHHRSASAARVGAERRKKMGKYTGNEEFNFFMAVYFPDNQLKIFDYNRVVKDLNGRTEEQFFAELKSCFDVKPADKSPFRPEKTHQFGMFIGKKWYCLTALKGTFDAHDPVSALDVSILQKNLLAPVLGINDPRTDKRIDFVGGIRGLAELEKMVSSGKFKVAFSMFPTTVGELMQIADSGNIMPPKSTWFEPKLRSGMVVHTLE